MPLNKEITYIETSLSSFHTFNSVWDHAKQKTKTGIL